MSTETFLPGDRVRIQDPKTLRWSVTGIVSKAICHQGATQPSSYEVTADSGGCFLRKGRFLRLQEVQDIPEAMNADKGKLQTSDYQPNNRGDNHEDSMNADSDGDSRQNNINADSSEDSR